MTVLRPVFACTCVTFPEGQRVCAAGRVDSWLGIYMGPENEKRRVEGTCRVIEEAHGAAVLLARRVRVQPIRVSKGPPCLTSLQWLVPAGPASCFNCPRISRYKAKRHDARNSVLWKPSSGKYGIMDVNRQDTTMRAKQAADCPEQPKPRRYCEGLSR